MKTLLVLPALLAACVPMNYRYEKARAQQVQRMCADPNYAYETGYNEGLERRRLDTAWVDTSCAPEWRAQVRQSYQNGFTSGMEHAPIVVKGIGGGGGGGYTSSTETCRFSSDCGDGRSCRADASGTSVCMGGGYAGDPCWFSSDCVSGSCDGSSKTCK